MGDPIVVPVRAAGPGLPPRGMWWACENPERPIEVGRTAYHPPRDLCRPCIIAAEAALMQGYSPVGHYLDAVGEAEAEAMEDRDG